MRSRFTVVLAALVAVAGLPVVAATPAAPVAAAAPVSCSGPARIFDHRFDGTVWYYEHNTPATGTVSWSGGRRIGTGFATQTVAGPGGVLYLATASGELRRYRYDGTRWTELGTVIGTGWARMAESYYRFTVDSKGRLFAVDEQGILRVFDSSVSRWDLGNGIPLDVGWTRAPMAAGDNVFFEQTWEGSTIYRWRYDPVSQRFTRSDRPIGSGFSYVDSLFSAGGDVLYRVNPANGYLYWYRYDADTGTWANNGVGKVIGNGWLNTEITASTDACSTAAPPPVGNVTPVPADPRHAVQGGGRENMTFAFRGDDGRAYQFYGTESLSTVGDKVFASDLSGATGAKTTLVGIDATGHAWVSQARERLSGWTAFGAGMTYVRLSDPSGGRVEAVATDAAGNLWYRTEIYRTDTETTWTAWRRVFHDAPFAGLHDVGNHTGQVFGTAPAPGATYWFTMDMLRQPGRPFFTSGALHNGGSFDTPSESHGYRNDKTLFARHKDNKRVYLLRGDADGFASATTWVSLPPLSADGSVTVDAVPVAVDEWFQTFVVAVRGSDGFIYVTSQTATNADTFHPWQRLGDTPAVNAPIVTDGAGYASHVAFLGQDGYFYDYVAGAVGTRSAGPLTFTGGRR